MASARIRGVFPILATPFDDQDRIDEESLRREIDFNIDAGVTDWASLSPLRSPSSPKQSGCAWPR